MRPKLLSPTNELDLDLLENPMIATQGQTIAPISQHESSILGDIGFQQNDRLQDYIESRSSKTRPKYSLKLDHLTPQNQAMQEIDPPDSNVLGGVAQIQTDAPVQFYRFTNARI